MIEKQKVDALQNQFSMLSNLYGTSVDAIKTQAEFDQLAREAEKLIQVLLSSIAKHTFDRQSDW